MTARLSVPQTCRMMFPAARRLPGLWLTAIVTLTSTGIPARSQAALDQVYSIEAFYDPMDKRFPDVGKVQVTVNKAEQKSYIIGVKGSAKDPNDNHVYRMDVSRRYLFSRNSAYRLPHQELDIIDGENDQYRYKVYRILPFVHLTRKILRQSFKSGIRPPDGSYFVPITEGRGNETLDLRWELEQSGQWHAILHDVDGKLGDFFLTVDSEGIPTIQKFYVNFTKEVEMRCSMEGSPSGPSSEP